MSRAKRAAVAEDVLVAPSLYEFAVSPEWCGRTTLSPAQGTILKAMAGEPLTDEETSLFLTMTGRTAYPGVPFQNVTVLGGSGGGKDSMIVTPVALHAAFFGGFERQLIPGQVGTYSIVAQDIDSSETTLGYLRGAVEHSPALSALTDDMPAGEIRLKSGIVIAVFPCTKKTQRGYSIIGATMNEVSFFRFEGAAESDIEIEASIRRGMRFPGARLLKVTTTYLPEGLAFRDYKRGWGPQDDGVQLTFKASTEMLWPGSAAWVEQARALWQDPDRASRELDAEFVDASINGFVPRKEVEKCVEYSGDLPFNPSLDYYAFADPSGLTEGDTWTFAICARDGERVLVAALRGYDGTDERQMMGEHAQLMRDYQVHGMVLTGDRYGGSLPARLYALVGVEYRVAEMDRSECYLKARKMIRRATTGDPGVRLSIPEHERLVSQFSRLEVDYREAGKVKVDHPKRKGSHDDFSNVVSLGAATLDRDAVFAEVVQATDVRRSNEQFGKESWRPDPHGSLGHDCGARCPGRSEARLALEKLKETALERGLSRESLARMERDNNDENAVLWLEHWLRNGPRRTLRDRMADGGLS